MQGGGAGRILGNQERKSGAGPASLWLTKFRHKLLVGLDREGGCYRVHWALSLQLSFSGDRGSEAQGLRCYDVQS